MKCPKCGSEVEAFIKKLKSKAVFCPNCQSTFPLSQFKEQYPDAKIEIVTRYPWEKEEETDDTEISQQTRREERRGPLFEPPKEPPEIVAEILLDYGCSEDFVKTVSRYIERKGYIDPNWLFNMLTKARTGRRFTEQEAFLVVDEIVSAIEQERRKAEALGRPFPFVVTGFGGTGGPLSYPYMGIPTSYPTQPSYPYMQQPPPIPSQQTVSQQPVPSTPTTIQPQYHTLPLPPTPPTRTLTPEDIAKIIDEKLGKRKEEEKIEKLESIVHEQDKKLIEMRHELENKVKSLIEEFTKKLDEIKNKITESVSEIRETQSQTQLQPQLPPDIVTKKDLELMFEKYEKESLKRELSEARREIAELREKASKPIISPEGWQKDETRLVAELGGRLLDIARDRRPIEHIVRVVVPEKKEKPKEEVKGEGKGIVDIIKEIGGEVE